LHHSGSRIKYGRDFTDSRLHETEVVKSAKTLPANAGLYATHFDHIYFYWLLGRPVKQLKSAPDKQTEPLNNAAYLLYFTPCCNENQLSPAALGFRKAETVLENHIYQIRHLQSI